MQNPATNTAAAAATACPNCGNDSPGNYCPECGQRRGSRIISLRRLIAEAIEDQLSLNAALPRTLALLITRPGRLTAEYLGGRIARYIPPFRLYLIASFAFFLVYSLAGRQVLTTTEHVDRDAPISINTDGIEVARIPWLSEEMNERARGRLQRLAAQSPNDLSRGLQQEITHRAPVAIFLLLPFLAAVLKLLYAGSGRFYVEHFVFAVHLQAFAFLVLTAQNLVERTPVPLLGGALLLWIPAYVLLAMKHVYAQSWPRTALKFLALGGVYLLTLGITMLVLLLLAFMLMPV